MAKKEAKTDLWVASQLKELGVKFTPQGSKMMAKKYVQYLNFLNNRGL